MYKRQARAGYKNPEIGRQLITKNNVLNYINELRKEQSQRTGINADTVLKELEKIALADTDISGKEKIKALELLGKHLGMFSERKEDSVGESMAEAWIGAILGDEKNG